MARKSSRLRCLKCTGFTKRPGGTLTRHRAGNGDGNEYFYMMHYDRTKKAKKRSCYLGYSGLNYVIIDDEKYHSIYMRWAEAMIIADKKGSLDEDKRQEIWYVLWNLLIDMGWPKKFIFHKLAADLMNIQIRERYQEVKNEVKNSAFPEKRRLRVDYSKWDDILDKQLSELFRSDPFKQPVDIRLKPKT
jgi:hypothetical protein